MHILFFRFLFHTTGQSNMFQFHCWSDLYFETATNCAICGSRFNSTVGLIYTSAHTTQIQISGIVSIPLLV